MTLRAQPTSPRGSRRRIARATALVVLAALLCLRARTARADDAPAPVTLDAPARVEGLRIADADGDGLSDVLVVAGREVRVWRGVKGGTPPSAPTWVFRVPEGASYVWPAPSRSGADPKSACLLALAGDRALRLSSDAPPTMFEGIPVDLRWSDPWKAVLTDFVRGPALLLPTALGFHWIPDVLAAPGTAFDLPCAPIRRVTPPGPFVEDGATLTTTWPAATLVPAGGPTGASAGSGAVVLVNEESLRHFHVEDGKVVTRTISTAFLPKDGDRRLMATDFDRDGIPDVVHEQTTNDSGVYTFLAARMPAAAGSGDAAAASFDRRIGGTVRLTGFQLPTDYVDLDADGLPDFVVTTIDIDKSNVLRAVMQGRVVAKTRAFLNHGAGGEAVWFHGVPDAEVESDVGVRILFTFSGSIDVKRSFTILATADLDGDGHKDLVIRAGDKALAVRRGMAKRVWEADQHEIAIPAVGKSPDVEGYVGDLSGDGKDDLVLLYRAPPGGADRTVVLVSR